MTRRFTIRLASGCSQSVRSRFLDHENLIHRDIGEGLASAARPPDLDPFDHLRVAHADVQPRVVAAQITGDVSDCDALDLAAGGNVNAGAEAEAVALGALRPDDDPVAAPDAFVSQQRRLLADARDGDVDVAVVVEVGDGEAAPGA